MLYHYQMSGNAQKKHLLSLVQPSSAPPEGQPEVHSGNLKDFFRGWLEVVGPNVAQNNSPKSLQPGERLRSLSTHDLIRLNRATVRESSSHRAWPPDVVEKFLVADVIKRNK